jgi:hypothetical protein
LPVAATVAADEDDNADDDYNLKKFLYVSQINNRELTLIFLRMHSTLPI